jgi:hypothetical protein
MLWLNLAPASRFDTVPQADFVKAFDGLFKAYTHVYIPLPSYNRDHTVVWDACMAAMRPGKIDEVTICAYEQPFSNAVGPQVTGQLGEAHVRVSEEDAAAKMHAIQGPPEPDQGPRGHDRRAAWRLIHLQSRAGSGRQVCRAVLCGPPGARMIIGAKNLRRIKPIFPFIERTVAEGMTFGLGPAGYDVRINDLHPVAQAVQAGLDHGALRAIPNDVTFKVEDKSSWARRGISAVQHDGRARLARLPDAGAGEPLVAPHPLPSRDAPSPRSSSTG